MTEVPAVHGVVCVYIMRCVGLALLQESQVVVRIIIKKGRKERGRVGEIDMEEDQA